MVGRVPGRSGRHLVTTNAYTGAYYRPAGAPGDTGVTFDDTLAGADPDPRPDDASFAVVDHVAMPPAG